MEQRGGANGCDWRDRVLGLAVIVGVATVGLSEALGALGQLTPIAVRCAWALGAVGLLGWLWPIRAPLWSIRARLWPIRARLWSIRALLWPIRARLPSIRAHLPSTRARPPSIRARLPSIRAQLPSIRAQLPSIRARPPSIRARLPSTRARLWSIRGWRWPIRGWRWPIRGRSKLPALLAPSEIAVLAAMLVSLALVGLTALVAPPNTGDSLSYHMVRVAHWQQQGSLAFYPAGYLPQLYQPTFAETAILQLQLIVGSDRLANLVQWLSLIGAAIAASVMARDLGGDRRGQLLAAAFVVSLPVSVLEGSSTQNDLVAAFWLIVFAASALEPPRSWRTAALAGAALGLSLLTKGTSYLFALPLIGVVIVASLRRRALIHLALIGTIALLINVPYYARNIDLFGAPLGPGFDEAHGSTYFVDQFSLATLLSNVVRTLALHVGSMNPRLDEAVFALTIQLHQAIGIDANSPLTTWGLAAFTRDAIQLSFHETRAANLIALVIILACIPRIWRAKTTPTRLYGLALAISFVLFCGLLKWQPWNSRLLLPWFVLAAPLVGAVASRGPYTALWIGATLAFVWAWVPVEIGSDELSGRRSIVAALMLIGLLAVGVVMIWRYQKHLEPLVQRLATPTALATALLVSSVPWVLGNETRPLLGPQSVLSTQRIDQYFANRAELEAPYLWAAEQVKNSGCANIGVHSAPAAWEYPLWVLLTGRLEAVDVQNVSARLQRHGFAPCALVDLRPSDAQELSSNGRTFRRVPDPPMPDEAEDAPGLPLAVFLPTR